MAPPKSPPRLTALLNVRSFFSFGAGVRSPTKLVAHAVELSFNTLGLADASSVAGVVELAGAAKEHGLQSVVGATVPVTLGAKGYPLGLIAATRQGYRHLNELLTCLQEGRQDALQLIQLTELAGDLFCLTGDRLGFPTQLFASKQLSTAIGHIRDLRTVFRDRLFVQVYHDRAPNDARRRDFLRALARDQGLPLVAAPTVRLIEPADFPLLDALTCARLGIDVTTPHFERPRDDAQVMLTPEQYARLIPFPDALSNASRIAKECSLDLLPERLTPPGCRIPDDLTAQQYLESEAHAEVTFKYPSERWEEVLARLEHELQIVADLGLAEFFLTAYEVAQYCERQGILASGRGSAAASVLCYLLGVTKIDPLRHDLLFERFLFSGKTSMPDVDFDISSARRREVIAWVEERWGGGCEAMVAAKITYRLPSAVQDVGRALGMPPEMRDRLSKALGRDFRHLRPHRAREAAIVFDEVLGTALVKHQLLDLLERMESGFVRQLNPHSGGVVLSKEPLSFYSPIDRSSGGLKMLSFDKDDAEKLGLIKLDLLGLRMLSAPERAREDVLRFEGLWLDFAQLPDEPEVWQEIRDGDTMGLFQIESPGQVRLTTQLRPSNMTQLAHQIALFRPGPIQSGTVHPYVRRARGEEKVPALPSPLPDILASTHGVILFQEQVLRILMHVCGIEWGLADGMRKQLSACEDDAGRDVLGACFVSGAIEHSGWDEATAREWFRRCAAFTGYGFAESHSFAFAQHAYASAWLRRHYPAPFWAGVLSEHPGMWPVHTLAGKAGRAGVKPLAVDINGSGARHRAETPRSLRLPFTAVVGVSEEVARAVVFERHARGKFADLDDFYHRVKLGRDVLEQLVLAGAFDELEVKGGEQVSTAPSQRFAAPRRREAYYRLGVLANAAPSGQGALLSPARDAPVLPALLMEELVRLDFATKGMSEAGHHPIDAWRGELRSQGCVPLGSIRVGQRVMTAGLVIARQRPPTAKGTAFFMIEDRQHRAQVVIPAQLWDAHRQLLRNASALMVEGVVYGEGRARVIQAEQLAELTIVTSVRGYAYG